MVPLDIIYDVTCSKCSDEQDIMKLHMVILLSTDVRNLGIILYHPSWSKRALGGQFGCSTSLASADSFQEGRGRSEGRGSWVRSGPQLNPYHSTFTFLRRSIRQVRHISLYYISFFITGNSKIEYVHIHRGEILEKFFR